MSNAPDSPSAGELVVRNGKRRGTRLPLRYPLTLIGSADACDVRLSGEGVAEVHCAVAIAPTGPAVRAVAADGVLVNGVPRTDTTLSDGDELKVGPCVFQVVWLPLAELLPAAETLPAEAAQIANHFDGRLQQIADREKQLAESRAAFRRERDAERDQLNEEREHAERVKDEAAEMHRGAAGERERLRRLGQRYFRRVRDRWASARSQVEDRQAELSEARGRLSAEAVKFEFARREFETTAASARDRMHADWAALDAQRKRFAAERTATDDFFAKQDAALDARAAEVSHREKLVAAERARLERETAGLRAEAAGLETRIEHVRVVIADLERQRDDLHAALLVLPGAAEALPTEMSVALDRHKDRDLAQWLLELDARDAELTRDRANIAAVKVALEREAADTADRRRVLAENLAQLAGARLDWQEAERRTVAEMEELARGLRGREQELDTRDQRLIRADARRRELGYDLWQLRLRLEAWHGRLLTVEARWNTERDAREGEYTRRVQVLLHREARLEDTFDRWQRARDSERERVRAELQLWADDRAAMVKAADEYDRRAREVVAELMTHASRAMASEEFVADHGSSRRLDVLRKRWEKAFERRTREFDDRRAAAAADLTRLDARFEELHRLLADVTERDAVSKNRLARAEVTAVLAGPALPEAAEVTPSAGASSGELTALRDEVERLSKVLLDLRRPDAPDPPDAELPWGAEEAGSERPEVLPFRRAA